MCGITGLWRRSGPNHQDENRLGRMASYLEHRGPDDFGYLLASTSLGKVYTGKETTTHFTPDVLLASRRLSITDLTAAGRQPISNEAGDVFVIFNGAIHNHLELRGELKALGHSFHSETDTEVIVHAYEQWGDDCAKRFNGMWAYAIWDQRQQKLVCSRDRFGIKPLFIAWHGDTFYFGSEVKAILAGGEIPAVPNLAYLKQFFLRNTPLEGRYTAFVGIEQVPAGYNLIVTRSGMRESQYWSYTDQSESYDFSRPVETFRELFADAVRLRLRSDVSIALLLSGGLDSSSIAVHAAQQKTCGTLDVFTAVFPGNRYDERQYAELVAARTGMSFHAVEYDSTRVLDDLSSVTWHMDAPPALGQMLARWQLLATASKHAKIVLEGQGADEMLAGYLKHYLKPYLRSEIALLRPWNLHRKLPRIADASRALGRKSILRSLGKRFQPKRPHPTGVISQELAAQPKYCDTYSSPTIPNFPDPLTARLVRDHTQEMLPYLLHFGDAISMAHSVESRLPFLDHRLVEFLFRLPFDEKMRGRETKHLLRKAFAQDLPAEILNRRDKVGFETPVAEWLQPHFRHDIRPLLMSKRVRERGIFDQNALEHCLAGFETYKKGAGTIFKCLAVERWFELFVDGEGFRKK